MNRVNRKKGPQIFSEYNIELPVFESTVLENGMPVHELRAGSQEIVRVDIVFKAGRTQETVKSSAKASYYLLREGSEDMSSEALADLYDYYGAYVKTFSGLEYSSISLVVLARYFEKLWPVFLNMVFNPDYPEDELATYRRIASQKLSDQLSKNDVITYRALTEEIFGEDHPYGYNTMPEDIRSLKRQDLFDYQQKFHGTTHAFAVLSGKYDNKISSLVFRELGQINKEAVDYHPTFPVNESPRKWLEFTSEHKAQTSIKMGKRLLPRYHPDYSRMQFVNTLLGGYFGSRLMKNLREEKGFTYGIYSSIDSWKNDGLFYISADIANTAIDQTLEEIYKEMNILKNIPVPDWEFNMVRNYKLGQILHLIDGPFASGQLIKNIYAKELEIEHFKNHISQIKTITPADIMEMSQKYLDENSFITVLAGNF